VVLHCHPGAGELVTDLVRRCEILGGARGVPPGDKDRYLFAGYHRFARFQVQVSGREISQANGEYRVEPAGQGGEVGIAEMVVPRGCDDRRHGSRDVQVVGHCAVERLQVAARRRAEPLSCIGL
jgi:hypothetical protein